MTLLIGRARNGRFAPRRTSVGSSWQGQEGAALIEVLVSAIVTGIAVTGLATMFSLGGTWVVGRGDNRVANYIAQQRIEQLRNRGFTHTALAVDGGGERVTNDTCPNTCPATAGVTITGSPPHEFVRQTTVTCFADDLSGPATGGAITACIAGTGVKRIRVQVTPTMRETEPVTLDGFCIRYQPLAPASPEEAC